MRMGPPKVTATQLHGKYNWEFATTCPDLERSAVLTMSWIWSWERRVARRPLMRHGRGRAVRGEMTAAKGRGYNGAAHLGTAEPFQWGQLLGQQLRREGQMTRNRPNGLALLLQGLCVASCSKLVMFPD